MSAAHRAFIAALVVVSFLMPVGATCEGPDPIAGSTASRELASFPPLSRVELAVTPAGAAPGPIVLTALAAAEPTLNSINETLIAGESTDETQPAMLMDTSGRLHVAYNYKNGSTDTDIAYAISSNGGTDWSTGRFPSSDDVRNPDLAVAESGSVWMVHEDRTRDNVTQLFRTDDGGKTWLTYGIMFTSQRIRNVRNLEVSVATNKTSGDALFMTGLAEYEGVSVLLTYYNDASGAFAAWSVGLFSVSNTVTGPWIAASPGLAISGGSARAYVGWEVQNNSDTDLGILYAEPWATSWAMNSWDDTAPSGNPALSTDAKGRMFLVGDAVDGAKTDLLVMWAESNAQDVKGSGLNTSTVNRDSFPRVYVDGTRAVVSYLVDSARIDAIEIPSGKEWSAAGSPAKPVADRRAHDVWFNDGTGPMLAWTDARGTSQDIYFWREAGVPGAPLIIHTPIMSSPEDTDILVEATVTDDKGLATVSLFYRSEGAVGYTELPMNEAPATRFRATIPASIVKKPAIYYYIIATDTDNLTVRSPGSGDHKVTVGAAAPLFIAHTAVTVALEGIDLKIEATVTSGSPIVEVLLFHRGGSGGSYKEVTMGPTGNNVFAGTIPGKDVSAPEGVDYYIAGVDSASTQPTTWKNKNAPQHISVTPAGPASSPTGGLVPWLTLVLLVVLGSCVAVYIITKERKRKKESSAVSPPPPVMTMAPPPAMPAPMMPMPGYAPPPGSPPMGPAYPYAYQYPPGFPAPGYPPPGPYAPPPVGIPIPPPIAAPLPPPPVVPPPPYQTSAPPSKAIEREEK